MVRDAWLDEVPAICGLLHKFQKSTGLWENSAETDLYGAVEHYIKNGVVLVSVEDDIRGVIIGEVIHNPIWNQSLLQEVVWYAEDNSGGKLLDAFIAYANSHEEVTEVYVTILESSGEAVNRYIKRKGFTPIERSYAMKL